MPKVISLLSIVWRAYTITAILSLSKIIPSPYSCYVKEGLVYITLASPLSRQPSFYLKYTKANIYLSYNVCSSFNAKYTRPITLNSY